VFRLSRRARLTHRFCACARFSDDEPAPEPPKQEKLQAKEPKAKKVKAKSGGMFDDDDDESSEDDGTSFFAASAPQSVAKGASFPIPMPHMAAALCESDHLACRPSLCRTASAPQSVAKGAFFPLLTSPMPTPLCRQ
jgi:hypothetical protein